jgi:hypothetical protein
MLTFVCFKWRKSKKGYHLPAAINEYTAEHVNTLQRMIARHYHKRHKFICVTDDSAGIRAKTLPLWNQCRDLGGCFNRLYTFSPEMRELLGRRFVCIDLDCVIVDDITPLFDWDDEFIINSYNPLSGKAPDQYYNGGMYMMTAGARRRVWEEFIKDPAEARRRIQNSPELCIGSDQAWIRLCLDKGEARWGNQDGVYEARQVRANLPENARIIFFAGARDPSQRSYPWVIKHWR